MNTDQLLKQAGSKSSLQMWKLLLIGIMILLLLIPTAWISSLIHERNLRKDGVAAEIAGKWGGPQLLCGPFVCVPYGVFEPDPDPANQGRQVEVTRYLYLAADSLKVSGQIRSVAHKRGLFKVTGYQGELDLTAKFAPAAISNPAYQTLPLRWSEALLAFDLADQRGLKGITASLNGQPLVFNRSQGVLILPQAPKIEEFKGGRPGQDGFAKELPVSDFQLAAPLSADLRAAPAEVKLRLGLSGTGQLNFASSALSETIQLQGDWPDPSFIGDALPESRSVSAKGFSAAWKASALNSGLKAAWTSGEPAPQLASQGVDLLVTLDSYRQATRALKYSILFLLLTFMTFFLAELTSRQKIHPLQYLMVGCGLLIFYLLLLSLSEHLPFGWAYLIAAAGVVLQISLYCFSILKSRAFALRVGALLGFLYAFLYVLLRLEDSALLIGSVSLFAMLSVAMYLVRNINWYGGDQTG